MSLEEISQLSQPKIMKLDLIFVDLDLDDLTHLLLDFFIIIISIFMLYF